MNRLPRREAGGQEGQVLVLFTGALLVLLLVVGLVIDSGFAWFGRRDAQNVSDLSALAGTREVAEQYVAGTLSSEAVYDEVEKVAEANGCVAVDGCTFAASYVNQAQTAFTAVTNGPGDTIPTGALGVQVDVNRPTPTLIVGPVMSMLNQNPITAWSVNTTATALTASARSFIGQGQLIPIALLEPTKPDGSPAKFEAGKVYEVTDETLDSPGSFGWLSWPDSSPANAATTLEEAVCDPNNPEFDLPTWIKNSPGAKNKGGVSNNGVKACLEYYMENNIPILVPVYGVGPCDGPNGDDIIQGTGQNTEYCIVGVVEMQLTELNWAPVVHSINATFSKVFAFRQGSVPAGTDLIPPSTSETSYFLGLVK